MSPNDWTKFVAAMRAAGRGEPISYENVTMEIAAPQPTAADLEEAEYHATHARIVNASAMGERDEMTERADRTPAHKTDE